MMDWIRPIIGGSALGYVLALLIAIAVVGCAANVPRIFPGPVTPGERAAHQRAWLGRIDGWSRLVLALACWVAIMLLIAPVSPPEVVVLHSRSRRDDVQWGRELRRWDGNRCERAAERAFDLGPRVDAAIAAMEREDWPAASSAVRARARRLFLGAELVAARRISEPADATEPRRLALPGWLIESIELSAAISYARSRNVRQLIVAPARTREVSSWKAAGAILAARGIELCLADELSGNGERFEVRRIAFARWSRSSTGALSVAFWALVDGRTPPQATPLAFRIQLGGSRPVEVDVPIAPDSDTARLVFVCVGECTHGEAGAIVTDTSLAQAPGTPAVVDALGIDAAGARGAVITATAAITAAEAVNARPYLELDDPAARAAWERVLDPVASAPLAYDASALADELDVLGLRLPSTKLDERARRVHVLEGPGRIAVADEHGAAAARQALEESGTAAPLEPARVHRSGISVNTALSWLGLPITRREVPAPLQLGDAPIAAGAQTASLAEEPAAVEAAHGMLALAQSDRGRVAVIAADVQALLRARDPIALAATLRTLAWATAWVTDRELDTELAIDERDEARLRGAPLLHDEDYDELRREDACTGDLIAILLLGAHLWVSFRNSPRRRR